MLPALAYTEEKCGVCSEQWAFEEEGTNFVAIVSLPPRSPIAQRHPEAFKAVGGGYIRISGRASDKKTAQQRAAYKVLLAFFPQLKDCIEKGPWTCEGFRLSQESSGNGSLIANVDSSKADDGCSSSELIWAKMRDASKTLKATTPSNTLNNLCQVS